MTQLVYLLSAILTPMLCMAATNTTPVLTSTTSSSITSSTTTSGSIRVGQPCNTTSQCADGADCYAVNSMLIPVCGNFQASCKSDTQCAFNTCIEGFCKGAYHSLSLGSPCKSSSECAMGAQCYATNSMLIPTCGSFQSVCTTDVQCATNTCNNGFCNGPLPQPGSLPLGSACKNSTECANGANCYATNSMLIPRCGNFQSTCTNNSQCAFNTCQGGLCNGFIPSGTSSGVESTATGSSSFSTSVSAPISGLPTPYPNSTITRTISSISTLTTCLPSTPCTGQTLTFSGSNGPYPCSSQCTVVLPGGTKTIDSCPPSLTCSGQTTQWTGNAGPSVCPPGASCGLVLPSQGATTTGVATGAGSVSASGTPAVTSVTSGAGRDEVGRGSVVGVVVGVVMLAWGML